MKSKEVRAQEERERRAISEYRAKGNECRAANLLKVKDWVNQYKLERGCIDCGFKEHPAALDLDHLGSKSVKIANCGSIQAAHDEIQDGSCVVRCSNHHRVKTWHDRKGLNYDPKIIQIILQDRGIQRHTALYKLKHGCRVCGYREHFAALDVHHVDGKGVTIGQITSIWRFDLEVTLFQCEVLCANHHQILHNGE